MNLLQIIPIMDPSNLWTGPHRVVFDLSRALVGRGHKVTVYTSDMLNVPKRLENNLEKTPHDCRIVRLRNAGSYLYNALGLLIARATVDKLEKLCYNVISVN